MRFWVLVFFLLQTPLAFAGFLINPKIQYGSTADKVSVGKDSMAEAILKGKADAQFESWNFVFDGFATYTQQENNNVKVSESRGYLNEAYIEWKGENAFFRAGKQSTRWSEMWLLPSLDLWTGRRLHRFYIDPQEDQLDHSSGLTFSYAKELWTIDLAAMAKLAETELPVVGVLNGPKNGGGVRFKFTPPNWTFSLILAQREKETWLGFQPMRAFESFVVKGEAAVNEQDDQKLEIVAVGTDIFWGSWIITPQVVWSQTDLFGELPDYEDSLGYMGIQYDADGHTLLLQGFYSSRMKESFFGASYGYNLWKSLIVTGFYENFRGDYGSLNGLFEAITAGELYGMRLECPL